MKVLMQQVLNINHYGKKSLKKEEKEKMLSMKSNTMEGTQLLIYRVCLYLSKMAMHDYEICQLRPSHIAVGAFYVSLKLSEQLMKQSIICEELITKLIAVSKTSEGDIMHASEKILFLAQNFNTAFSGLDNLKRTHYDQIDKLF
jgi:hypothetical protein